MKALVIDDSKAMRSILGRILINLGFEVVEAEHGQAGLERLRETSPTDLVLVDWNMPVMDGLGFLKAVRQAGDLGKFRTIVVTTETESGRMTEALAEGADEYVMKPFTQDAILLKLEILGLGVGGQTR
jgi:two-component system chemotaxis response regulator CheY